MFAFSTNAFTRYTLFRALEAIRRAGFSAVKILADRPHVFLGEWKESSTRRLQQKLSKLGLAVSNLNANTATGFYRDAPPEPFFEPSLISRNAADRKRRLEYTRRAIQLAAEISSPTVSITSGKCLAGVPPEKAQKHLKSALDELLPLAERCEVRLAIEYEPGLFLERTGEVIAFLQELPHPQLGANLDIGHAVALGEDPAEAVRLLQEKLFHLHLEDIRRHKHYHLLPGEGEINFPKLARALEEVGYRGYLTWEIYTYEQEPGRAARAAWEYSQGRWAKLLRREPRPRRVDNLNARGKMTGGERVG